MRIRDGGDTEIGCFGADGGGTSQTRGIGGGGSELRRI